MTLLDFSVNSCPETPCSLLGEDSPLKDTSLGETSQCSPLLYTVFTATAAACPPQYMHIGKT